MDPVSPLSLIAAGFTVFAVVLLLAPVVLVAKKIRKWRGVMGLWIAGWGFLLIGVGTHLADRGWGSLAVAGVVVATAGHLLQRRTLRNTP